VSGRFGAARGCIAVMAPLAMHPTNKNELLAWDLSQDPRELADLQPEQVRARLFTSTADLPDGTTRLPIKGVHLNKSPIVVGQIKTLRPELAERWGIPNLICFSGSRAGLDDADGIAATAEGLARVRANVARSGEIGRLVANDLKSALVRADLLEILDDRVPARSTILISQLPVDTWHAYLGEPTLADAILDRLVHHSHRIPLAMRCVLLEGRGRRVLVDVGPGLVRDLFEERVRTTLLSVPQLVRRQLAVLRSPQ